MSPALKAALHRIRALLFAAVAGGGAAQMPSNADAAISAAEQQTWAQAQENGTAAGYQRYLELFPTGQFAEEAFRSLVQQSLTGRPLAQLVEHEITATGEERELTVSTAQLALY